MIGRAYIVKFDRKNYYDAGQFLRPFFEHLEKRKPYRGVKGMIVTLDFWSRRGTVKLAVHGMVRAIDRFIIV